MIFNKKNEEYMAPSIVMVDVACEAGYKASSGNLTYGDGWDDGWFDVY